jgi:hypothetical protein
VIYFASSAVDRMGSWTNVVQAIIVLQNSTRAVWPRIPVVVTPTSLWCALKRHYVRGTIVPPVFPTTIAFAVFQATNFNGKNGTVILISGSLVYCSQCELAWHNDDSCIPGIDDLRICYM